MYSVEAEILDKVVAQYGPGQLFLRYLERRRAHLLIATKVGAIVAGQTSVKAPEQSAFEKYLPLDTQIVSCHSLHGPTISTLGQPLVRKL
jgi:prephenate dehydrogenase (NADP+)